MEKGPAADYWIDQTRTKVTRQTHVSRGLLLAETFFPLAILSKWIEQTLLTINQSYQPRSRWHENRPPPPPFFSASNFYIHRTYAYISHICLATRTWILREMLSLSLFLSAPLYAPSSSESHICSFWYGWSEDSAAAARITPPSPLTVSLIFYSVSRHLYNLYKMRTTWSHLLAFPCFFYASLHFPHPFPLIFLAAATTAKKKGSRPAPAALCCCISAPPLCCDGGWPATASCQQWIGGNSGHRQCRV